MFKTLTAALFAALSFTSVAFTAAPSQAAVIDVPVAYADFVEFDGVGDLTVFGAPAAGEDFDYAGELLADLTLDFETADPYATANGSFNLWSDDGLILTGVLKSITAKADLLAMTFADLDGVLAGSFAHGLSLEMFFFDMPGANPLGALVDGGSYEVAMTGVPSPVPLPAGALLLISGAAALAGFRRVTLRNRAA